MQPINIKINRTDLALLDKKLKKLKKFSKQEFSNQIGFTVADIASKAVAKVPVDTGNLKQSISYGATNKNAYVEAKAVYAPYIEFGTGGFINTNDAQELGINPAMIKSMFKGAGVKEINLKPRPYFFNSVREGFNSLLKRLNKTIKTDLQ